MLVDVPVFEFVSVVSDVAGGTPEFISVVSDVAGSSSEALDIIYIYVKSKEKKRHSRLQS